MIARAHRAPLLLRLAAPFAWRGDARIANKLLGFAATEFGSALDMFRAAELIAEEGGSPRLRRLFYRHGLDEARHAQRFASAAKGLAASGSIRTWEAAHADRQDLYERLGLLRFVAFVYLSERRALSQFQMLTAHFAQAAFGGAAGGGGTSDNDSADALRRLFEEIAKDEQFHTAYSKQLLDEWSADGRSREVKRALRWVKLWTAWTGWRRAGRRIGDRVIRVTLAALYVTAVPLFAGIARLAARRSGSGQWRPAPPAPRTLADLRKPY